ncbi:MAG: DNA repair protein RadA [Woeseiaceae bacterium]|nr:DNA repair protein RadA [Woeseiaceae bacterium]
MARTKTAYVCNDCGAHSVKWAGQCPECAAWNTLSEIRLAAGPAQAAKPAKALASVQDDSGERYSTGMAEFDRVLGGGLVPGAVVLLGGDPGVGKSTLLQQVSARLPDELPVCYASGEESLGQIGRRSKRLGLDRPALMLLAETSVESILDQAVKTKARVLIIDSMQTMSSSELPSAPGSVAQLRECVGRIVQFAKQNDVSVFIVGHVTKEGAIAGPRVVEHMVDTVLYFENDPSSRYTMIRSVKNRFGASSEMGVFAMTDIGFREVSNPSAIFLSRESSADAGSVVSVAWQGSRPLLLEIQALVADGSSNYPKRLAQGVDQNRLGLLLAVLQRHGDVILGSEDVFVNVVGGLKISETSVDLPILLAIVSSFRDQAVGQRLFSFGEVGLAGEVRPVRFGEERIRAAEQQGFDRAIVPRANVPRNRPGGIEVIGVSRLQDALDAAF